MPAGLAEAAAAAGRAFFAQPAAAKLVSGGRRAALPFCTLTRCHP